MTAQPARLLPRYPIFIPSKRRADVGTTARTLLADDVPFRLVVEPQERDDYANRYGDEQVLVLPFANLGQGSIPARNWIIQRAIDEGHERHWQLDDNIRHWCRLYRDVRLSCPPSVCLRVCEDFSDRYENVAISGLNYQTYGRQGAQKTPFTLNCRVYSCSLVNNSIPHRWRGRYNEDADLCLQVLADGWCTVLVNAFLADKAATMKVKGGNTDELYAADGRLSMARSLERVWPGVVDVRRRSGRPQHVVRDAWRRFDNPLRLRADVDVASLPAVDEYGLRMTAVDEVRSPKLRALLEQYDAEDD